MDSKFKCGYRLTWHLIAFLKVSLLSDSLFFFLHAWQRPHTLKMIADSQGKRRPEFNTPSTQMSKYISVLNKDRGSDDKDEPRF